MTVTFHCTCGKQLKAPEEFAGRVSKCPGCGSQVTVPPAQAAIQPNVQMAMPVTAPAGQPFQNPPLVAPVIDPGIPGAASGKAIASLVLGLVSFCLPFFLSIPAIIFGILSLKQIGQSQGRLRGKGLAISGIIAGAFSTLFVFPVFLFAGWFLVTAVGRGQDAARKIESSNNLKQMALAMHIYHDASGVLPPGSQKGLSWRVLILPYVEQGNLYNQFHLDEAWDSPHNIKLLPLMPKLYVDPRWQNDKAEAQEKGLTYYQVFVTQKGSQGQAAFSDQAILTLGAITNANGTSRTLMIVEAGDPIPWTKPGDLPFTSKGDLPHLGGPTRREFYAAFCDGHVQIIPGGTSPTVLRQMINWKNTEPFNMPY